MEEWRKERRTCTDVIAKPKVKNRDIFFRSVVATNNYILDTHTRYKREKKWASAEVIKIIILDGSYIVQFVFVEWKLSAQAHTIQAGLSIYIAQRLHGNIGHLDLWKGSSKQKVELPITKEAHSTHKTKQKNKPWKSYKKQIISNTSQTIDLKL